MAEQRSDDAANILIRLRELKGRQNWFSLLGSRYDGSRLIKNRLKHATDGLSHTIMWFEDAGRPFSYYKHYQVGQGVSGASWGDQASYYDIGHSPNGSLVSQYGPCANIIQNCFNNNETYSFHTNAANYAFGDGSVRSLSDDLDVEVYASLFTYAEEDFIEQGEL